MTDDWIRTVDLLFICNHSANPSTTTIIWTIKNLYWLFWKDTNEEKEAEVTPFIKEMFLLNLAIV